MVRCLCLKLILLDAQRSACFLWKIGSFELTGKFISVISLKVNSLRINYGFGLDGFLMALLG